ncbi:hypothetical protein IW261DRAFT_1571755 [Armillaria novae-zelandiae]|uniref:RING-type domain-containing protein n=1 Tax=Armillaria novae-zelandiae TaxID=153914 RepID=A0AA39NTS4_9AGAR|nr:hypothetical protein IW261DRAFT_1571755 [Armillaria novae-zelandiae]
MHSQTKAKPKSSKAKTRSLTGKGEDDPLFQGTWVPVAKPLSGSTTSPEEASTLAEDRQQQIGLYKNAQRDAEQLRQRLAEVEAQLNLEMAKSQLHMHECNSMKDLTMRQLALSLEQERCLASENTALKDELRMLKDPVSETDPDRCIAAVLQMEEQVAAYEDDHNRMEFFQKSILPLLNCGICLSTVITPALLQCGHSFCAACLITWIEQKLTCPTCRVVLTKRPVMSIALSDIVAGLMGTSPDGGLRVAAQIEFDRLPYGLV